MNREASAAFAASAAAALIAFGAFFASRGAAPHGKRQDTLPAATAPSFEAEASARVPLPTARAPSPPSAPAPGPREDPSLDEAALMQTLRQLRGSDPNLTLRLAREGNRRFKASADAAERSWFVVKALSDLGRHDEARVEGRILVDEYRGSRWAEDVHRHLFVNPPTHPSERGYGKILESDP